MKIYLAWVLLLVACTDAKEKKTKAEETLARFAQKTKSGPRHQVMVGSDRNTSPRLGFKILAVYEKQKPEGAGHTDGGDWIFFDAETAGGARFAFGLRARPTGDDALGFGEAWLAAPDRESGAKLAAEFARGFRVSTPAPSARKPLAPLRFAAAILGRNTVCGPSGCSGAGTWTATKLFPSAAGKEAEVFFNFDLVGKTGELAQKDAEYDQDVASLWALGLRDSLGDKEGK